MAHCAVWMLPAHAAVDAIKLLCLVVLGAQCIVCVCLNIVQVLDIYLNLMTVIDLFQIYLPSDDKPRAMLPDIQSA